MIRYSIEPRTRKYAKVFDFVLLWEIYPTNMEKKLLNTARKTGIDPGETASKK